MSTVDDITDYVANAFFVFVLITIPVYVLVVACIIYYRKHLTSSFFHLSAAVGVADIWLTLHKLVFWTCSRLFFPDWAMKHETVVATYSKFGAWYYYFATVFGVVIISANRLMALMFPLKYKSWWSPKVTKLSIVATWILPLPYAIPMMFPCCYSRLDPVTYRPKFALRSTKVLYYDVDLIVEQGIIGPLIIIMYLLMFWKARQRARAMTGKRGNKKEANEMKVEVKLAIMGVIISGLYVVMLIVFTFWYFDIEGLLLYHVFVFSSTLFSVSNPYLLLLFSTKLRSYFVQFVTCGRVVPKDPMSTASARGQGQSTRSTTRK